MFTYVEDMMGSGTIKTWFGKCEEDIRLIALSCRLSAAEERCINSAALLEQVKSPCGLPIRLVIITVQRSSQAIQSL